MGVLCIEKISKLHKVDELVTKSSEFRIVYKPYDLLRLLKSNKESSEVKKMTEQNRDKVQPQK